MKAKTIRAIAWLLIIVLSVGIITDWLVAAGCNRGWQYIYNGIALFSITGLLVAALGDKLREDGI